MDDTNKTNVTEEVTENVTEEIKEPDKNVIVNTDSYNVEGTVTTVQTEVTPLPKDTVTITVPKDISSKMLTDYLEIQIKELETKERQTLDMLDIIRNSKNNYQTWYDALKPYI